MTKICHENNTENNKELEGSDLQAGFDAGYCNRKRGTVSVFVDDLSVVSEAETDKQALCFDQARSILPFVVFLVEKHQ